MTHTGRARTHAQCPVTRETLVYLTPCALHADQPQPLPTPSYSSRRRHSPESRRPTLSRSAQSLIIFCLLCTGGKKTPLHPPCLAPASSLRLSQRSISGPHTIQLKQEQKNLHKKRKKSDLNGLTAPGKKRFGGEHGGSAPALFPPPRPRALLPLRTAGFRAALGTVGSLLLRQLRPHLIPVGRSEACCHSNGRRS